MKTEDSARSYGDESSERSHLSYSMSKNFPDYVSDGRLSIEKVWRNEKVRVRSGSANGDQLECLVNPLHQIRNMRTTGGSRREMKKRTVSGEMKPHDRHLNPHRSISKKRQLSIGQAKSV